MSFDWLPGDCLISTAFVSYLGPFVSNYREELIGIWMKEVSAAIRSLVQVIIVIR